MIRAICLIALIIFLSRETNKAEAACASTNECSSKIQGTAVLQGAGLNVSKIAGYAVLAVPVPPSTGIRMLQGVGS